jgi:hypothetical protein
LKPVRLRSGRTGQDRTKPDFCRIFFDFFAGFLPDFCRIDVKNDPAGFRPDQTGQILKLAGPDRMQKIRPVPTLVGRMWSESNMKLYLFCERTLKFLIAILETLKKKI